ncbi:MAG: hypothetical protein R3A79_01105 [Nannocystaceae bacterium]
MQARPWIAPLLLGGSLALGGCYSDSAFLAFGVADSDSDGAAASAGDSGDPQGATSSSTGEPGDGSGSGSGGGGDTDGGSTSGVGHGGSGGLPDEQAGPDLPPTIHAVTIDGDSGPSVTITSACTAQIVVDVSDDWGLAAVSIDDGAGTAVTLTAPPYAIPWMIDDVVAAEPHTIAVEVVDSRGQQASAIVDVDFELPAGGSSRWKDAGPVHYVGAVEDLAIAESGAVVAVGARALAGAHSQAVVRRLSSVSGELELDLAYPPSPTLDGDYRGAAVVVGSGGALVIAGDVTPKSEPGCPSPWVAAFTGAGEALAERRLQQLCGRVTAAAAVVDGVIIVGQRFEPGDENEGQAWIARLGADLSVVWERTLTPPSAHSVLHALVVDDSDGVYTVGTRVDDDQRRILAFRLDLAGDSVWGGSLPAEEGEDAYAEAVVIGEDGELAIGGAVDDGGGETMMIRWLSRDTGETLDQFLLPDLGAGDQRIRALAVDAHGRIYVAGTTRDDDDVNAVVYKRSHDGGAEFWERIYDNGASEHDRGNAIAVDPHGFVFAAGSRSVASLNVERPRWWIEAHNP